MGDTESHPVKVHCGSCTACIDICPTKAIIAPYTLDAGACISYLTIEHKGSIDVKYRKAIGNRIFGCDDCQLICPWNRYAKLATVADYAPRHGLDEIRLLDVWAWDEDEFLQKTEGSPLRRTGYLNLLRNTAIAIGNSQPDDTAKADTIKALRSRLGMDAMLDEHIYWAIDELTAVHDA